jgi:thymidine kinase
MQKGRLEVLTGPMFAGKTSALMAKVRAARDVGLRVGVFKPHTDTRVSASEIRTHAGDRMEAIWAAPDGSTLPDDLDLVALDEAQFYTFEIVPRVLSLLGRGTTVIAAGLDLTSKEEPFGPMPALLALADEVVKLTAMCACGGRATRSYRKAASKATVLIGGADTYEARCKTCFDG